MNAEENNKSILSREKKLEILREQLLKKAKNNSVEHPLSYGQKALWFLYQSSPESSSYNVAFTARVISELNVQAFKRACQKLLNRHPVLRTTYILKDGKPFQVVNEYQEIFFEVIPADSLSEEVLNSRIKETYNIPFVLEEGPLFKVYLYKISSGNIVLLINMHHIVTDGWSLGILLKELEMFYSYECENKDVKLIPLRNSYFDYVKKQQELIESTRGEELLNYWTKQLSGSITSLKLPFDKPRPKEGSGKGDMVYVEIENNLTVKLRAVSKSEGVTVYTLLISVFLVLLHKYSNQNDILIGSTTAGRNISDTENLVGYFVSPVVIRAIFSEDRTFKTFLKQMRKTILGALSNQDFPFPLLVEKLMPVREPGVTPLFQVEFGLYKISKNDPVQSIMAAGNQGRQVQWGNNLRAEYYEMTQQEGQFDLLMELIESEDKISGYLKYSTDLFEEETIRKMSRRFKMLLENILKDTEQKISNLSLFEKPKYYPIRKIKREVVNSK